MKTKFLICVAALLCVAAVDVARKQLELPRLKVTAEVIDESGKPLTGALVRFVFGKAHDANAIVRVEGRTDARGEFAGEGHSGGSFGCDVTKDGYYPSGVSGSPLTEIVNGKSQMIVVQSILRPIGMPVALYAKKVQTEIPALDQPCGYDLEKGDWVAPYGTGSTADFVFTIRTRARGIRDFNAQADLTFAHPRDGLRQVEMPTSAKNSAFKWERLAPDDGFVSKLHIEHARFPEHSGKLPIRSFRGQDEWQGYFFRVRTVEKEERIVSALYGKIRGDVVIEPRESKTCTIFFTYYLNPTSLDRNLEWDTKRNLLSGLNHMETPREP